MNNFNKFLEELNNDELELFEKDLKDGYVQKYIDRKKEYLRLKDKSCAVCGNIVDEECFVLTFGEPSIRKRAHFCGYDCMQYFIEKNIRKDIKSIKIEKASKGQ